MKHDVSRWLLELAYALEQAAIEVDAPLGDIQWLLLRCRDTMGMEGELRVSSLGCLVQSFAEMLRRYPTAVPELLLHAAMTAPGRTFACALLRAEALALGMPGAPRWDTVTISGPLDGFPARQTHVELADLVSAGAFSQRFDQLMSLGYPWINLSVAGVLRGALLVTVETPTYTQSYINFTSVNLSGPPKLVQQRADWRIDDLVLIEDSQ